MLGTVTPPILHSFRQLPIIAPFCNKINTFFYFFLKIASVRKTLSSTLGKRIFCFGKVQTGEKIRNAPSLAEITYVNHNAYLTRYPSPVEKSVDNVENSPFLAPIFRYFPFLHGVILMHKRLHNSQNRPFFSCYVDKFFHIFFGLFSPKKLDFLPLCLFPPAVKPLYHINFCESFTNSFRCMKVPGLANTVGITFWEEAECREK